MNRDDFELVVVGLLLANLAMLCVVGEAILRELGRRPRVVGIIDGGGGAPRPEPRERREHAASPD